MIFVRASVTLLITVVLTTTLFTVSAQQSDRKQPLGLLDQGAKTSGNTVRPLTKRPRRKPAVTRPVIPPVTVLHNPEYLSGESSVTVAANSNPLIRIGIAQNGITLIEFPAADKFFAVHAGNSDLVTVEKSPSLKRDHHLVLRAGSGFLVPSARAKGVDAILPATSIVAQMDSGMAITLMIYPVPLLKQQAHRLVINYKRDEVISARHAAGLATNLVGRETDSQVEAAIAPSTSLSVESPVDTAEAPQPPEPIKRSKPDFKKPTEDALQEAAANPKLFKNWAEPRHGLRIATVPPRELNETVRLVLFAVRNTGSEPLRLISGYPDLYVETLNDKRRPVEAGTRIQKLHLASSGADNLLSPGMTLYFALAYEAPILGAQQHLKVVVAHMNAADEPATADLTALAR
jgi:hypothetical protein